MTITPDRAEIDVDPYEAVTDEASTEWTELPVEFRELIKQTFGDPEANKILFLYVHGKRYRREYRDTTWRLTWEAQAIAGKMFAEVTLEGGTAETPPEGGAPDFSEFTFYRGSGASRTRAVRRDRITDIFIDDQAGYVTVTGSPEQLEFPAAAVRGLIAHNGR